jgi:hypothetical protein
VSASNLALNWGKNAIETFEMLKVCFGDRKMGTAQGFEWLSTLKNAVTFAEDVECSGCAFTRTDRQKCGLNKGSGPQKWKNH